MSIKEIPSAPYIHFYVMVVNEPLLANLHFILLFSVTCGNCRTESTETGKQCIKLTRFCRKQASFENTDLIVALRYTATFSILLRVALKCRPSEILVNVDSHLSCVECNSSWLLFSY